MNSLKVAIVKMVGNEDIPLPRYMSEQAAGMDVCAAVKEPVVVSPGQWALIPTGFALALPEGWEAQVRPRSGLALRYGVSLLNSPGTIDADYRGEVKIIVVNHGSEAFTVKRGERIAQLIFTAIWRAEWEETTHLSDTKRGSGGFGGTGVAPISVSGKAGNEK